MTGRDRANAFRSALLLQEVRGRWQSYEVYVSTSAVSFPKEPVLALHQ